MICTPYSALMVWHFDLFGIAEVVDESPNKSESDSELSDDDSDESERHSKVQYVHPKGKEKEGKLVGEILFPSLLCSFCNVAMIFSCKPTRSHHCWLIIRKVEHC